MGSLPQFGPAPAPLVGGGGRGSVPTEGPGTAGGVLNRSGVEPQAPLLVTPENGCFP